MSEGEGARERERGRGRVRKKPGAILAPRGFAARTHAGRSVRPPPASDAVSRFAPIAPKGDATHSLIDRALKCFSRCQSGDICSRDETPFRASPPPRTWTRITRKSAIAHSPWKPVPLRRT